MKIVINTIPHRKQRYPTVGDWFFLKNGTLRITVSELDDWRSEFLVALHELCEVALCKARGIDQDVVDTFDQNYEENRTLGDFSEPGDDPLSPYRKEHFTATTIERIMCQELGLIWKDYDDTITAIG